MCSKISFSAVVVMLLIASAATAPTATAADDACLLLTQAQVSAAVGVPVGAGTHVTPTFLKTCTWATPTGAKKNATVTLFLQSAASYEGGKNLMTTKSLDTPVSGVGDDGYYFGQGKIVALLVKKGTVAFKVAIYGGDFSGEARKEMEKKMALEVVSKL